MIKRYSCVLFALLLIGCAKEKDIVQLPPEEVLKNSVRVSQELQSARFTIEGDFRIRASDIVLKGQGEASGVLNSGGDQVQLALDVQGASENQSAPAAFRAHADVVVGSPEEVYVRISELTVDPPSFFFDPQMLGVLMNKWWLMPSSGQEVAAGSLTPDPRLLHAQAQVVGIMQDEGLTMLLDRPVYHFRVAMDPEKMTDYLETMALESSQKFNRDEVLKSLSDLRIEGELWIDAETYQVHRFHWNIETITLAQGAQELSGAFTIDLLDHNSAPTVSIPESAEPFTPEALLSRMLPPTNLQVPQSGLDPLDSRSQADQELLEYFLSDQ